MGSQQNSVKLSNIYSQSLKPFKKVEPGGPFPNSWHQDQSNTKTVNTTRKENYRPIFLINMDSKILNKIFTNRIETYIQKSVHRDQVSFILGMQEWVTMYKSINIINT